MLATVTINGHVYNVNLP